MSHSIQIEAFLLITELTVCFISFIQITVMVAGASMGFVWTFKFIYIADVAYAWDPNFSGKALGLLQGFDLCIETILGEIPFFFLSGKSLANECIQE